MFKKTEFKKLYDVSDAIMSLYCLVLCFCKKM